MSAFVAQGMWGIEGRGTSPSGTMETPFPRDGEGVGGGEGRHLGMGLRGGGTRDWGWGEDRTEGRQGGMASWERWECG